MCDRTLWLKSGQVEALGASHDVINQYQSSMLKLSVANARVPPVREDRSQSHLVYNQNRFGTLEHTVSHVAFVDGDGNEIDRIGSYDDLRVRIWVDSGIPMNKLHLSISMVNDSGIDILDINTGGDDVELPSSSGKMVFQLDVGALGLAPGRYSFTVGLYDENWDFAYDRHVDAYELHVEGEENWCLLTPPNHWSVVDLPG
jgi:hypothetical protein